MTRLLLAAASLLFFGASGILAAWVIFFGSCP